MSLLPHVGSRSFDIVGAIREWQKLKSLAHSMEAAGKDARAVWDRIQEVGQQITGDSRNAQIHNAIDRTNTAAEDAHFEQALNKRDDAKSDQTQMAERATNPPNTTSEIIDEAAGGEAAGAGIGAASGKGRETAIMRQPKRIRWNLPDYNHAKLIYTFSTNPGQLETGTENSDATDLLFNLNGCHDIIETNALFTDISNGTTSDENSSGNNQPKGWAYFKALYEKYTVLNCEYDINGVMYTDAATSDTNPPNPSIAGSYVPPKYYWFGAEVGVQSNDYNATALELQCDMSVKHHKLALAPSWHHNITTLNGVSNSAAIHEARPVWSHTFSGNGNMATYDKHAREIADDDANVIWNDTTSNATLVHRLRVGVRPATGDYTLFGTNDKIIWSGRIIYTVQFRQKVDTMHGYRMGLVPA